MRPAFVVGRFAFWENVGERTVIALANYPNYMPGGYQTPQQTYYNPVYAPQYAPMQQQCMISGRMVTSREEAMGVPADFTSGITVCPDMGHGVVYIKVFDPKTGTAPVVEFHRADARDGAGDQMTQIQTQLNAIMQLLEAAPKGKHVKEASAGD